MSMKGISPVVSTVLIIAVAVGAVGIISIFFSSYISQNTASIEKRTTGVSECSGVFLKVDDVNSTSKTIVVSNPSKNRVYTTSILDSAGNINDTASAVQKSISAGGITSITTANVPVNTSTRVTVKGFCETSEGGVSSNVTIEGICDKGTNCWPS
jgi:FlaG/FlaF family flagellin (archaellin)